MNKKPIKLLNSVVDIYKKNGLSVREDVGFVINNFEELDLTYPHISEVYRTNYYTFLFVIDGKGSYTLDDKTYNFSSGTFYFSNPGHIKSHSFDDIKNAYRIAVTEEFIIKYIHPDIFDEFPFLIAETSVPQKLSESDAKEFEEIYKQIHYEFHSNAASNFSIIGKYVAILLFKIRDKFWKNYLPLEEGDRNSQIVKAFKQNLEQHFLDVSQGKIDRIFKATNFAELQNLNTNYFNQVIKSKTGKTVTDWLNSKMLTLAKGLLIHSPKNVKEIAYLLGFSDTAHFNNFFKKLTGNTPGEYRKANFK